MVYKGVVVDAKLEYNTRILWYITKIEYVMPNELLFIQRRTNFPKDNKKWWLPVCLVHYRRMRQRPYQWLVSKNVRTCSVVKDDDWSVVDPSEYDHRTVEYDESGQLTDITLAPPQLQHPHVAANKPFFFSILGFDKYHHTQFTGLNSMNTHGCYWWIGNFNPDLQFNNVSSFVTCQAPAILGLSQILPKIYSHWQFMMEKGCLLWIKNGLQRVYGMVSHHIGDMQDRDILLRRRGTSSMARCDGMLWTGFREGVRWPSGVEDLMELNTVVPGPYMLDLWKHLNITCVSRGLWSKVPNNIGKSISLTKATEDVFNCLPIGSSLKGTLELNHTTMLGLLVDAFEIEWTNLHINHNFNQHQTRCVMNAYLNKFWCGVNGVKSFLNNINTNILVFNQIRHSWHKMLEIMISLPYSVNWCGNLKLLTCLVRMTGALVMCNNENERERLKQICIPLTKFLNSVQILCKSDST